MTTSPTPRPRSAATDRRGSLGRAGEQLALERLEADGLRVLARNWRLSVGELRGELDIVALDEAVGRLVVCEVKTRTSPAFGGPLAAVTPRKQAKIRALTAAFLREAQVRCREVRFDVVGIVLQRGTPPQIDHVMGAF